MPFPNQTPRPYSKADIEKVNAGQIGVYGIYRKDAWIYVGRGDIRARMLSHVGGDNPRITREKPTGWVSWVTASDVAREKELIVELQPLANQKVG